MTYWTNEITTEEAVTRAITKANEEYPDIQVWGALAYPAIYEDYQEIAGPSVVVYGGTNEEDWFSTRTLNEGVLAVYRPETLLD